MKNIILSLCFIFISLLGFSQNGTIRGFVYDKVTGEPILFANVILKGTSKGSTTNENGYFVISKLSAGSYQLMIKYIGYKEIEEAITIEKGKITSKNFYLEKNSVELKTVNITASKYEAKTETKASVIKLTPQDIERIPTIGGQADIAQYMQVLPGVVFTGDQGGQLYIRGGEPIQNKVLLDGLTIYNPFHSIGLFSVFDNEIIKKADIYTGGFGAEFGGRISSIMDISTKDGNKSRIGGKFNAGTFGTNLTLEGPLKKLSDNSKSSASFIFSAKHSYLEQTSKIFYKYVDKNGLPFNFTDLYGKMTYSAPNGSKVSLFGFNFNDEVNQYKALSDFKWVGKGLGSTFIIIPGTSSILLEGRVGYSSYLSSLNESTHPERTSSVSGYQIGFDLLDVKGNNYIKYGLEINSFTTDFHFTNSVAKVIEQKEYTTEMAAYVKMKYIINKWILEPSLRGHYYASLSEFSPEPRLAIKYNASNQLRFKLAGGIYAQNLISASNQRDVVNLFYGILSSPENLPKEFDGKKITSKLQHAQHVILGMEYDLTDKLTANVEGYFKNFSQITGINRNKLFDENTHQDVDDQYKKDFIVEKGNAYGLDFLLKYQTNRLYVWAVYSLGFVNRNDGITEYVPLFDRRHNVNLTANYQLGKRNDWELSFRWNLGSGFPFTQTQGAYGMVDFSNGIETDYTTVNEDFELIYADYNNARLSYYHRLDMGLKKIFFLSQHSKLNLNFGITNIYNRKNIFYINRIEQKRVNQLPILPNFSINLTF